MWIRVITRKKLIITMRRQYVAVCVLLPDTLRYLHITIRI